jgi:hypothetical protein
MLPSSTVCDELTSQESEKMRLRAAYLLAVTICLMLASVAFAQAKSKRTTKDETETVYSTFYVIPGKEDEFWKVLERAWPTYYRLGMVLKSPHLILRGADAAGRPYFIEILTWKDHDKPDHAPAEVQAIWDQMTALCEKRDGHRRIEFYEVKLVEPKK